jgi:alpha-ribazole phosphatase
MALQQSLDDILKMTADLGQLNRFILDSETMQLELLEDGR